MKQNKIFQASPDLDDSDVDGVVNYLNSGGWITEHKVTANFEDKVKQFVNRDSAFCVPNGTIAIYLALLASGIKDGKRVAVPNITMIATINAIIWARAIPVLIDVDESLCMSYENLTKTENLDAVIFVPLNGRTGDGLKIESWCFENNITLIEDSAHALGSSYDSKKCGGLGDLSVFSFTPHKIITMGQGGMVLTDNKKYGENIYNLKTFNRSIDKLDWHEGFGLNFKITDLQATLGISQFKKIKKYLDLKKNNWELYKKEINNKEIKFINFKDNEVPWFFDVVCSSEEVKEEIKNLLDKEDIETRDGYPALSFQGYLSDVERNNLAYSESISNKILWLPSSNNLSEEEVSKISKIISNYKQT